MIELIQAAFDPVNLLYTVLLVLVLVYWLSIILGALDFGSFDIDFDLDLDVDMEVDTDVDVDGASAGWFAHALYFFNFGKMPFMVIMSLIILSCWTISVLANYYFGQNSSVFAIALFFPNLFLSLCITKFVSSPLVPLFKSMETSEVAVDYIGLPCTITIPATSNKMGQAEVIVDDSPLLINIKMSEETLLLKKGAEALIIGKENNRDCFLIQSEKN